MYPLTCEEGCQRRPMLDKAFWISCVAAFLIVFTGGWFVHGTLLHNDYSKLPNLFRAQTEANSYFPFLLLAYLSLGFAFAWIYRQGISAERPWLLQGFRFGLAAMLLATVPMYLIYFVVEPMTGTILIKQIAGDGVTLIICGVIVAFINKSAKRNP